MQLKLLLNVVITLQNKVFHNNNIKVIDMFRVVITLQNKVFHNLQYFQQERNFVVITLQNKVFHNLTDGNIHTIGL